MDDTNSWDCSVCTFRNGAEAFKCMMCDVRKGTSTRKPRINPEMVAKQVARQQEQIKQQVLKSAVKPKNGSTSGDSSKSFRRNDDSNSSMASTTSSGPSSPTVTNSNCSNDLDSSNHTANSPSFFDKITSSNKSNTACSSATTKSPTPSSSRNSFKMNSSSANNSFENEVDENSEIDSTSNGTTCNGSKPAPVVRKVKTIGPRAKLKNVDRTDVIVRSVTVNNVTVLITEFKPKRKFTEVSDNLKAESPNKKAKDSPTKIKDGAKPKTSAVTPTVDAKKAKCAKTEEKKKRQSSSDTPIEHNNSFSKKIPSD